MWKKLHNIWPSDQLNHTNANHSKFYNCGSYLTKQTHQVNDHEDLVTVSYAESWLVIYHHIIIFYPFKVLPIKEPAIWSSIWKTENGSMIKHCYWQASRKDSPHLNKVVHPYDWTYTTDYKGDPPNKKTYPLLTNNHQFWSIQKNQY